MRKIVLVTLTLVLMGSGPVWAKQGHSQERRMEHLSNALSLDESQKGQLAELMKQHHTKMQQLRAQNKSAIKAILTDEQSQKFLDMQKKRQQKRDKRGQKES